MSKYQPLADYLRAQPASRDEVSLTLERIEAIIRTILPASARKHRAWWANHRGSHVQADAWLSEGFEAEPDMRGTVRFVRRRQASNASPGVRKSESINSPVSPQARNHRGADRTVALLSCVSMKRPSPSSAKDLYASPWFKKARQYVEQQQYDWYILSAQHGLLSPDSIISPYEKALSRMPIADRRNWAAAVVEQLSREVPPDAVLVVLASLKYREFLLEHLEKRYRSVSVPMEGLRLGEQLEWLDNALRVTV